MRLRAYVLSAMLLWPGTAGAAPGGPAPPLGGPKPACQADGTSLAIAAAGNAFDKACLAVKAGQPFSIALDNRDAVEHNVAIVGHHGAEGAMFRGELFAGPRAVTYEVSALPAGIYHFHCEAHSKQMMGIFSVEGADGMAAPMAAGEESGMHGMAAPMAAGEGSGMHATAPMTEAGAAAEMAPLAHTGSPTRSLLLLAGMAIALGGITIMGTARSGRRSPSPRA